MIILACATELECRHVLARTGRKPDGDTRFDYAGLDFLACVTGVGPVAAALRAGEILERHPAAVGIVNLGICGSFDPHSALGAVCVASAEVWPEYGVHRSDGTEEPFGFQMLQDLPLSPVNRLELDPSAAASDMGLFLPESWPCGTSLTVAGVTGDPQRAALLLARHEPATENMEGFGLALAARRKGIAFLEVRTVSNPVGVRDKSRWNFRLALDSLESVLPTLTGAAA
ncbi:Futalosine hydrolase [anaerobic digester metagenome]